MLTNAPGARKYRSLKLDWNDKEVVREYKSTYQRSWRAIPENKEWERMLAKIKKDK